MIDLSFWQLILHDLILASAATFVGWLWGTRRKHE